MHVEITVICLIFTCCLAADDILKTAEVAAENDAALVMYSLTFHGLWTKERFPKMFPLERPKAKWSAMLGRTHSASYKLFSIGDYASPALQMLFENSKTELLAAESQGHKGVFDTFSTSPMESGNASTTVHFFADSEHPLVSLVLRIDPSPDWFVGIDSLSLVDRQRGGWAPNIEVGLYPLDGGTQQGYTFTSPRWPTDLREAVQEITNLRPNRTADAFYYPHLHRLPPIAWVGFKRMRTYGTQDEPSPPAGAPPLQSPPAGSSYGGDVGRVPRPGLDGRRHGPAAFPKSKAITVAGYSQNGTSATSALTHRATVAAVPATGATSAGRRQAAGRTYATSMAPLFTFLALTRPDDEQVFAGASDTRLPTGEPRPATVWSKTAATAEFPVTASTVAVVAVGLMEEAAAATSAAPLQRLAVAEAAVDNGGSDEDVQLVAAGVVQMEDVSNSKRPLAVNDLRKAMPSEPEDVHSSLAVATDRTPSTAAVIESELSQPMPVGVEQISRPALLAKVTANGGDNVGGLHADREDRKATGAAYSTTEASKESETQVGSHSTRGGEGTADDRDGADDDEDDGQEGSGADDSAWRRSRTRPTTQAAARRLSTTRQAHVPFLNRAGGPSPRDGGRRGAQRLREFPSLLGLRGHRTSSVKPVVAAAAAAATDNVTNAGFVKTPPLSAPRVPTSQALEKASRFQRPPTEASVREVVLVKIRGEPLRVTRQDSGSTSVTPTHCSNTVTNDQDAGSDGVRGECPGPRAWTEWTECSRACGSGLKERTRVVRPADGSAGCRLIRDQAVCRNSRSCTADHFLFVDKLTAGAA